jgi:hypothetical protein
MEAGLILVTDWCMASDQMPEPAAQNHRGAFAKQPGSVCSFALRQNIEVSHEESIGQGKAMLSPYIGNFKP